MAKLKNHETCGVTLSLKNCFGNTPASIYGDDVGEDAPTRLQARAASMFATTASGVIYATTRDTAKP
jgi:uncharacterized protein (DUF362 family)